MSGRRRDAAALKTLRDGSGGNFAAGAVLHSSNDAFSLDDRLFARWRPCGEHDPQRDTVAKRHGAVALAAGTLVSRQHEIYREVPT